MCLAGNATSARPPVVAERPITDVQLLRGFKGVAASAPWMVGLRSPASGLRSVSNGSSGGPANGAAHDAVRTEYNGSKR